MYFGYLAIFYFIQYCIYSHCRYNIRKGVMIHHCPAGCMITCTELSAWGSLQCTCMAGLIEVCSHQAAIVFDLETVTDKQNIQYMVQIYYIIHVLRIEYIIQNIQLIYLSRQFCLHFSTSSSIHNFTIHI